jgi:hypothetical protein
VQKTFVVTAPFLRNRTTRFLVLVGDSAMTSDVLAMQKSIYVKEFAHFVPNRSPLNTYAPWS